MLLPHLLLVLGTPFHPSANPNLKNRATIFAFTVEWTNEKYDFLSQMLPTMTYFVNLIIPAAFLALAVSSQGNSNTEVSVAGDSRSQFSLKMDQYVMDNPDECSSVVLWHRVFQFRTVCPKQFSRVRYLSQPSFDIMPPNKSITVK